MFVCYLHSWNSHHEQCPLCYKKETNNYKSEWKSTVAIPGDVGTELILKKFHEEDGEMEVIHVKRGEDSWYIPYSGDIVSDREMRQFVAWKHTYEI